MLLTEEGSLRGKELRIKMTRSGSRSGWKARGRWREEEGAEGERERERERREGLFLVREKSFSVATAAARGWVKRRRRKNVLFREKAKNVSLFFSPS